MPDTDEYQTRKFSIFEGNLDVENHHLTATIPNLHFFYTYSKSLPPIVVVQ